MPLTTVSDLAEMLKAKGKRLSLAESCTGGLIASKMTSIPGSSAYFLGSAVTYSNESKESVLGVRHSTLLGYGAVSEETAREMALGSLKAYCSDIAASVTGIAGPDGGTEEKPVGTVWMAVTDGKNTVVKENHFSGTRDEIRKKSTETLIDLICAFAGGKT